MKNHASLEVDLVHVREFNQELGDGLENKPAEYLPLVRKYNYLSWPGPCSSNTACRCPAAVVLQSNSPAAVAVGHHPAADEQQRQQQRGWT